MAHRLVVGLADRRDDPGGALEVGLAFGRGPQAPRRPVEELDPQPLLELRDDFRQGGRRDAQVAGDRGEAALVDGPQQDVHRKQLVHVAPIDAKKARMSFRSTGLKVNGEGITI